MDIDDFYSADPRRRAGEDHSFGSSWSDAGDDHHLWDLFWNEASSELYLVAKPVLNPWVGYVGFALQEDMREIAGMGHRIAGVAEHLIHPRHIQAKTGEASPRHSKDALTEELTVEIVALIPSQSEVEALLQGWQAAMAEKGSLAWLRARLAGAGAGAG